MLRFASMFRTAAAIAPTPAKQGPAMIHGNTPSAEYPLKNQQQNQTKNQNLGPLECVVSRRRRVTAIVACLQVACLQVACLQVAMLSGCANLAALCGHEEACCPDAHGSCLPMEISDVPPAASINTAYRCVDPLPEDAIAAPNGTYLQQWRGAMSAGAQQAHWQVSRNEWFDGGTQLGPEGRAHVQRLAECLLTQPQPVVIEAEPVALAAGESYEEALQSNQRLQIERRNAVVEALAQAGVSDAPQWVVFADDRSVGVRGIEAPQIYNRQFTGNGTGNRGGIGQGRGTSGFGGNNGFGSGGLGGFGGGFGGGGIF